MASCRVSNQLSSCLLHLSCLKPLESPALWQSCFLRYLSRTI